MKRLHRDSMRDILIMAGTFLAIGLLVSVLSGCDGLVHVGPASGPEGEARHYYDVQRTYLTDESCDQLRARLDGYRGLGLHGVLVDLVEAEINLRCD